MDQRVALAYSGGLDTSTAIPWLRERGYEVLAVLVDVGQPEDLDEAARRAEGLGAEAVVVEATDEFCHAFLAPAIQANALYEGVYPLGTALARPLIAAKVAQVALARGCTAVAHGCTAKGNDQVRFETSLAALAPDLEVLAPARVWGMDRTAEAQYLAARGFEVPGPNGGRYSVDANLWGRSIEGGELEDPGLEPPEEAFLWTSAVEECPPQGTTVEISFEGGLPVALDGHPVALAGLIEHLNGLAGRHGVGRIDHVESRVVGIKSREVYEYPAATALLTAHRALEALTLPRDLLQFKALVEQRFSTLVYDGQWQSPLRQALQAFTGATQSRVTGWVRVKLHSGNAIVVARGSPFSLYDGGLATYREGDAFKAEAAAGFLYITTLPARTWTAVGTAKEVGAWAGGT